MQLDIEHPRSIHKTPIKNKKYVLLLACVTKLLLMAHKKIKVHMELNIIIGDTIFLVFKYEINIINKNMITYRYLLSITAIDLKISKNNFNSICDTQIKTFIS